LTRILLIRGIALCSELGGHSDAKVRVLPNAVIDPIVGNDRRIDAKTLRQNRPDTGQNVRVLLKD